MRLNLPIRPCASTALARLAGVSAALAAFLALIPGAEAQISGDAVKIGVLTDESGQFSDIGGAGSSLAAQMAADDFGQTVQGKPITIVHADHQNKPDIGSSIVRRWFDNEGVDAIADLPVSSVALAAQEIARNARKTLLIAGAATSDLTGKACSPYTTHWADDTYALAAGTAKAVLKQGGKSWYFVTADYSFGHSMERDAAAVIKTEGGSVQGSVRHPLGNSDFSSYLLQAQGSGAEIIALANAGADTTNSIKQASEFGITEAGQKLVGFLIFITDINSMGLDTAKGLLVSEGFYWDQNEAARSFAKRFFDKLGKMPTKQQAATYASITHYLKAIDAIGTDDAARVNEQMRKMPVDFLGRDGSIRSDGRVLYDLTLYQVKAPTESKYPWDYYSVVAEIPKDQAFRALSEGGCATVAQ
jgi:branched-chain amino acid transport system substrate-binding protein